jgi:uncharacterized protein YjdB
MSASASGIKIAVSPKTASLVAPATQTFTAALSANKASLPNVPVTWTSSDTSVATVSSDGKLRTTGKRGTVTITATAPTGASDNATVTVTLAATTIQRSSSLVLSTVVGTALANYPAVRLLDALNNPVPNSTGVSIAFSVISGSCSTSAVLTTTDANGIASLSSGNLTLPSAAGSCIVRATSSTLTGSPIDFDIVVGPSASVFTWP